VETAISTILDNMRRLFVFSDVLLCFCFIAYIVCRLACLMLSCMWLPYDAMWANAQRDGSSAEYRWRPLFNAAKFGWRPLL